MDVSSFSQGMLACIHASYLDVELRTTVAGTDDDRLLCELTKRFQDGLTQLLQSWDVLRRYRVVDAVCFGSCTTHHSLAKIPLGSCTTHHSLVEIPLDSCTTRNVID